MESVKDNEHAEMWMTGRKEIATKVVKIIFLASELFIHLTF